MARHGKNGKYEKLEVIYLHENNEIKAYRNTRMLNPKCQRKKEELKRPTGKRRKSYRICEQYTTLARRKFAKLNPY